MCTNWCDLYTTKTDCPNSVKQTRSIPLQTVIMASLSSGTQFQLSWTWIPDEINAGNTQTRHIWHSLLSSITQNTAWWNLCFWNSFWNSFRNVLLSLVTHTRLCHRLQSICWAWNSSCNLWIHQTHLAAFPLKMLWLPEAPFSATTQHLQFPPVH